MKGRWKLVHNAADTQNGDSEIFDIVDDPYETNDLAGERKEIFREMKRLLEEQSSRDFVAGN